MSQDENGVDGTIFLHTMERIQHQGDNLSKKPEVAHKTLDVANGILRDRIVILS
jgi:hypothetical protein